MVIHSKGLIRTHVSFFLPELGDPSAMAYRRNLAHRFLDIAKNTSSYQIRGSAGSPDLLRRPIVLPAVLPDCFSPPVGNKLIDIIRDLNANRIRSDLPLPPSPNAADPGRMTVEEAKKVLRASQMETVRARLSSMQSSSISYSEYLRICREESSSEDSAKAIALSLDESGSVIAIGSSVFIRPGEVARAIQRVIAPQIIGEKDERIKELKEMEAKKAEIDKRAAAGVRRELWCGLGLLVAQTLGFMRLTFWELSWDVMEPVCFFVTSIYFMAGYAFFLRTSNDPSFEGFFDSRFAAKQRRIMRKCGFDPNRFRELQREAASAEAERHESASACSCCSGRGNLKGGSIL
ncbi:hypothetical protein AXF42_Ash007682 [Apostasia shenzhenica]|uniref:Calcium uniporter protein C-terminal domain-containing protein n=1 Tax=Apostasia shenzhenica TaxID=1088818 RepID=A0A2I0A662_9ASPA|nr:hypothetical protein AXF42_Ash007682 [Apostasia shenzhenica]